MNINFDTAILEESIKTILRVTGAGAGGILAHFQLVNSETVKLSTTNKGIGVALMLPCKVTKKSDVDTFSVDPVGMLAAISKRKDISIEATVSTVIITSGKYKAELVTTSVDVEPILPKDIKDSAKLKLSPETVGFIRDNLSAVELKPILSTDTFMPIAVKITSKGAKLICYDNWHLAYVFDKEVTGDIAFSLPQSSLSLLVKEFQGTTFSMVLNESTLFAYNKSFQLALPLPQQDAQNQISADDAFAYAASLKNEEAKVVQLSVEDLSSLAANMESVFRKGEHVDFQVSEKSCKVTLKSTHGKVSSVIRSKADTAFSFRSGFAFLKDVLHKIAGASVEFKVIPNKCLFFKKDKSLFMIALSASDNDDKKE